MTVAEELTPAVSDPAADPAGPENETEEPIKQRKNGLYPGVSDELAENMKSGWADTELR
jgi:Xaa-Pro aminopeptidase